MNTAFMYFVFASAAASRHRGISRSPWQLGARRLVPGARNLPAPLHDCGKQDQQEVPKLQRSHHGAGLACCIYM